MVHLRQFFVVPHKLRTVRGDVLQANLAAASSKRDLAVLNVVSDIPKTAVPLSISRSNVLPGESRSIGIHQASLSSELVLAEEIGPVGAATTGEGHRFHSGQITFPGMSGGPIVDSKGDVVSITCTTKLFCKNMRDQVQGPTARTIRTLLRSADPCPSRALRLWPGAADSDEIFRIAGSVLSDRYSQMRDLHLLELQQTATLYYADLSKPHINSHDMFDYVDNIMTCDKFPISEQLRFMDVNVVVAREYSPLYTIDSNVRLRFWKDIHKTLVPGGEVVVLPWRMNSQPPEVKQYLSRHFDLKDRRTLPNCLGHKLWVFRKKPE